LNKSAVIKGMRKNLDNIIIFAAMKSTMFEDATQESAQYESKKRRSTFWSGFWKVYSFATHVGFWYLMYKFVF